MALWSVSNPFDTGKGFRRIPFDYKAGEAEEETAHHDGFVQVSRISWDFKAFAVVEVEVRMVFDLVLEFSSVL